MTNEQIVIAMNELKADRNRKIVENELLSKIEALETKILTTSTSEYSAISFSLNDIDKHTLKMYKEIVGKPNELISLYEEERQEPEKVIIPWSKEDYEQHKEEIDNIYNK